MTIAAILKTKGSTVTTIKEETSVAEVTELLRAQRIGAVVVLDAHGVVAGILSERDIVRGLATMGAAVLDQRAGTIMTAPVITCAPGDSVHDAMEQMTSGRFRHLPVMEGGQLAGLVSIGDLVKRRIEQAEQEAGQLREYITLAG